MTAPAQNVFGGELRNSASIGVSLTPGNNTYPTPVELFGSASTVAWPSSSSDDDAYALEVNINSAAVSGQSKDLKVTLSFVSTVSGVDTTDNELDFATPHGLDTADGPAQLLTTGSAPGGLSTGVDYWIIRRSSGAVALATSEANARAGTAIDITSAGSGTHTLRTEKFRHLSGSEAGALTAAAGGGATYYVPCHIPAGVLIYGAASVDNATVGTANVLLRLLTEPDKPWQLRTGTFMRTIGAVPASSAGTSVTPANGSKGAYADLGATADDLWHWNFGIGYSNATFPNNNLQLLDLAVGESGAERLVIRDAIVSPSNGEQLAVPGVQRHAPGESVAGENVFVRMLSMGTVGTGWSAIGYGVGGRYQRPGAYAVAGTVTIDDEAAANGETVTIYAVDSDGIVDLVTTTTVAGGAGAFTVLVPDNTRTYFASYEDGADVGRSASGTPGVSTFDITIGGASADPPIITQDATTSEAIRDRMIALIAAITPLVHARERFKAYRNEGGADFRSWAEGVKGGGAFRYFQVRDTGAFPPPDMSNLDVESCVAEFEILVAYPQDSRMGKLAALDRDDAANKDQHEIIRAIGVNGYANFTSSTVPATPFESRIETRIEGDGVDFVHIVVMMRFFRRMVP